MLRDDIKEIRADIKTLLGFRAQSIGIVVGISAFVSIIGNCLMQ